MKRIVFFAALFLIFTSNLLAGEPTLRDRVIGAAFKGLASTYLAAYDMEKGKKEAIGRLEAMSDEAFVKDYAEVWPVLEGLPENLRTQSGISNTMTRSQLIARVQEIKKEELRGLINAVPDEAISREFDAYAARTGDKLRHSDPVLQIQKAWQQVMDKIDRVMKRKS